MVAEKRYVPMSPCLHRGVTSVTADGTVLRGIASLPLEEGIKIIDEWREAYPELVDTPIGRDLANKRAAAAAALAERDADKL